MIKIPEKIQDLLNTLKTNGYEAYIVGGCVRDSLLGLEPSDFDVTTSARPEEIMKIFPHTVPTGLKHGTITVIMGNTPVEVTTFRTEGQYKDSRHPENVEFVTSLETDLARRDFTVNAIAFSPETGLKDYFGGLTDLQNRTLRAVGSPEIRFKEDALRILRLFRFSSQLDFKMEENTLKMALELKRGLENISRERISAELLKALSGKSPMAIAPLINSGGLKFLGIEKLPDLNTHKDLRLYILLKECENPIGVLKELKASNKTVELISNLLMLESLSLDTKVEIKTALRLTDLESVTKALTLLGKSQDLLNEILESQEPYLISHLAVTGEDLIKKGYNGKEIGKKLNEMLQEVISDPSKNKKEILLMLHKIKSAP